MSTNLTPFQQKLVDDLIKEFTKINPKPTPNGTKRFTFDTIAECNKEEERFKQTISKHNLTMMKVFVKQLEDEVKDFKKEFGKAFDVQYGGVFPHSENKTPQHTLDGLITETKKRPLQNLNHYEVHLFFVSKTNVYRDDSRWDYCNGKKYIRMYVDFKRECIRHILESGKEVTAYKIVGLEFRLNDYLHRDKCEIKDTLDELIQTQRQIQTRIVELAS